MDLTVAPVVAPAVKPPLLLLSTAALVAAPAVDLLLSTAALVAAPAVDLAADTKPRI
jgi:hypothetical protein